MEYPHHTGYGPVMLRAASRQMQDCGMQGFLFAHDADLYDVAGDISLATLAEVIARYQR